MAGDVSCRARGYRKYDLLHAGSAASSCPLGRWQNVMEPEMITIGIILCSFSILVAAYASSILMVYAWAFLTGLASSFVYIPALTTVQWWYPGRKGLVTGFVSMVFGLSAAIMSPLFGKMLTSGMVSMNLHCSPDVDRWPYRSILPGLRKTE
jgi:MFS family permease